jgi:transposase
MLILPTKGYMDEDNGVVSQDTTVEATTDASQAGSQPIQSDTVTTEKSQNLTGEDTNTDDSQDTSDIRGVPKTVPYERLAQVIQERNDAREKALLFDRIQQDPTLAQAVLKNVNFQQPDPVTQQADAKLREMGYVRSHDVEQMISSEMEKREFIREFGKTITSLSEKHNGADGTPKFDPEEIVSFMDEKGIKDPELAYEIKFREQLVDTRAKAKGVHRTQRSQVSQCSLLI